MSLSDEERRIMVELELERAENQVHYPRISNTTNKHNLAAMRGCFFVGKVGQIDEICAKMPILLTLICIIEKIVVPLQPQRLQVRSRSTK